MKITVQWQETATYSQTLDVPDDFDLEHACEGRIEEIVCDQADWLKSLDSVDDRRILMVTGPVVDAARAVERGDLPSGSVVVKLTGARSLSSPGGAG